MVELAAVELVGKLTRLPYWQCLGTPDGDPEVQREIEDWFTGMDAGERIAFVKERLRERRWYDGALDSEADPGFRERLRCADIVLGVDPGSDAVVGVFHGADLLGPDPGASGVPGLMVLRVPLDPGTDDAAILASMCRAWKGPRNPPGAAP